MYWQQIERQDLLKSSRIPASAALPLSTVKGASYIPQRSFRTIVLFSEKLKSSRSILSKLLFSCQQLWSFRAALLQLRKLSNHCSKASPIHSWWATSFCHFPASICCQKKRCQNIQGEIHPVFPTLPTWLYAVFWQMGYLVWLPRGDSRQLEGKVSGFCFPKERLLRRPFIVTEDENQEFLVWAPSKLLEARRSLCFCGGRGRGVICYEREWSECRGRQGQTLKCINAIHTSHVPAQLD